MSRSYDHDTLVSQTSRDAAVIAEQTEGGGSASTAPPLYEHDTTAMLDSMGDMSLEAGSASVSLGEETQAEAEAYAAFMRTTKAEDQGFQGNRYAMGGSSWSREQNRVHCAPPGPHGWADDRPRAGRGGGGGGGSESDSAREGDEDCDPLDNYLVDKLNPFSTSHEMPDDRGFDSGAGIPPLQHTWDPGRQRTDEDLPSLARDAGVHGQRFRKFKDLFFEKSRERSNETGGVKLYEPITERASKKGEFEEDEEQAKEGGKVAQNILQASVLSAIRKETRNEKERKYITDWLMSVEFLHNLNHEMRAELAKCVHLVTLRSGEYLFKKGDAADGFYVLFKGAAKLLDPTYVPTSPTDEPRVLKVLKNSTDHFGEVALFSNKPRSLSIMAEGESTFVFIKALDFLQVMQGRKQEETAAKTALLQSMPLFEQCSAEQLHNTAMFMFGRKYEKGALIAKEGDECANIYLVESGEVELRQDVRVVRNIQILGEGGVPGVGKRKHMVESEAQSVGLTKVMPGNVFGALSLQETPARWSTSAVATHRVTLYMISKSEFLRFHDDPNLPHPRLRQAAFSMRRMYSLQRDQLQWRLERLAQAVVDCHPNVTAVVPIASGPTSSGRSGREKEKGASGGAGGKTRLEQRLRAFEQKQAAYEKKLLRGGGASGGKEVVSMATRMAEEQETAAAAGLSGGGPSDAAAGRDARGFAVETGDPDLDDARRRLAAMAAHEMARAQFDKNRVSITKHVTAAQAKQMKRKEARLLGKAPPPGAEPPAVDAETSFSYTMAVQAKVHVMRT